MKRPEITKQLSELLEKHIDPHNDPRVYWAKEVTFDYATSNKCHLGIVRPDDSCEFGERRATTHV